MLLIKLFGDKMKKVIYSIVVILIVLIPSCVKAEEYSKKADIKEKYVTVASLGKEVRRLSGFNNYLMSPKIIANCIANLSTLEPRGMDVNDLVIFKRVNNRTCHAYKHMIGFKSDGWFPSSTPEMLYHNLNLGMMSMLITKPSLFSGCMSEGALVVYNKGIQRVLVFGLQNGLEYPLYSGYHKPKNPCKNQELNTNRVRALVLSQLPQELKGHHNQQSRALIPQEIVASGGVIGAVIASIESSASVAARAFLGAVALALMP